MTYRGKVLKGKVILPPEAELPDGTEVEITPLSTEDDAAKFTDGLLEISKKVHGLPPDLARNHDNHLHGHPKK